MLGQIEVALSNHQLLRELQNPCPFAADLHPWVICIADIVKALFVLVSLG